MAVNNTNNQLYEFPDESTLKILLYNYPDLNNELLVQSRITSTIVNLAATKFAGKIVDDSGFHAAAASLISDLMVGRDGVTKQPLPQLNLPSEIWEGITALTESALKISATKL